MKNTRCCPKCHSGNIVRVPDNSGRHASGNNIYTTTMTLFKQYLHYDDDLVWKNSRDPLCLL